MLHRSTLLCGWDGCTASTCSGSFLQSLVDLLIRFGVLRTRHARTVSHPLEGIPSALGSDLTAEGTLHPLSHLWSTPQAAILGRILEGFCQFLLLLSRKQGLAYVDLMAMILDAFFPSLFHRGMTVSTHLAV